MTHDAQHNWCLAKARKTHYVHTRAHILPAVRTHAHTSSRSSRRVSLVLCCQCRRPAEPAVDRNAAPNHGTQIRGPKRGPKSRPTCVPNFSKTIVCFKTRAKRKKSGGGETQQNFGPTIWVHGQNTISVHVWVPEFRGQDFGPQLGPRSCGVSRHVGEGAAAAILTDRSL